jgi:Putative beta-lactamase-inhibitor-like, PepSY-like
MKPSKKTYLLTSTILILALLTSLEFTFSQKVTQPKIPAAVTTAFAKQYPGIPVKWEKEDGQFEASFTKDATPMSITYEANGNIFETEAEIKVAALPESIKNYVKTHYPGSSIQSAAQITKANGSILFEAHVRGKDLFFDSNGNLIKK